MGNNTGNKKILIVDDEAYIRLLIEQTLEDLEDQGVEILTTDNGLDALQLVREEKPDLVILDVMMPKMNGYDVCRVIKRDLLMDDVYVVLLTAKGQEFDRQIGTQAGADIFMTKPFDPDELLSLTMRVLTP
jgi:DNA-binding response OmpR family regulator